MGFCSLTLGDFLFITDSYVWVIESIIKNQSNQTNPNESYCFNSFLSAKNSTVFMNTVNFSLGDVGDTIILIMNNCVLDIKNSNFEWSWGVNKMLADFNLMRKIIIRDSKFQVFFFKLSMIFIIFDKE